MSNLFRDIYCALFRIFTADPPSVELARVVSPSDFPEYIEACADLAKLGFTADQLQQIVHAAVSNRILGFGWGDIRDLGETAGPYGRTRGTEPYKENR